MLEMFVGIDLERLPLSLSHIWFYFYDYIIPPPTYNQQLREILKRYRSHFPAYFVCCMCGVVIQNTATCAQLANLPESIQVKIVEHVTKHDCTCCQICGSELAGGVENLQDALLIIPGLSASLTPEQYQAFNGARNYFDTRSRLKAMWLHPDPKWMLHFNEILLPLFIFFISNPVLPHEIRMRICVMSILEMCDATSMLMLGVAWVGVLEFLTRDNSIRKWNRKIAKPHLSRPPQAIAQDQHTQIELPPFTVRDAFRVFVTALQQKMQRYPFQDFENTHLWDPAPVPPIMKQCIDLSARKKSLLPELLSRPDANRHLFTGCHFAEIAWKVFQHNTQERAAQAAGGAAQAAGGTAQAAGGAASGCLACALADSGKCAS